MQQIKIFIDYDTEMKIEKYKVTLFTKYFEVPTSLSCENIISYVYINAKDISEVKDKIYKRFNDRKEILKIEKYTKN